MNLPTTYIVHKFYQHAGYPRYKRANSTYEAGCPICREGKSWGRKRRSYYIPNKEVICCHNCGWYGSAAKWIHEVENISYDEIKRQIAQDEYSIVDIMSQSLTAGEVSKPVNESSLPHDSINLFNNNQLEYFKDNKIVQKAISYIKSRRLDTACNKPSALYISLTDPIHKNRICFPNYNRAGKIIYYQTRKIIDDSSPKYLTKMNSEKGVFGIENISDIYSNMYIFEGPADSYFVENSIAVSGIQENSKESLTKNQQKLLQEFCLINKVWVLDNQYNDKASLEKSKNLAAQRETVFIWPRSLKQFKDVNEMCMYHSLNEISLDFIDSNSYTGTEAILKLNLIV